MPQSPVYSTFRIASPKTQLLNESIPDLAWLLGKSLSTPQENLAESSETDNMETVTADHDSAVCTGIPTWSAYHSLVNDALPLTQVNAYPLIAAPAHEWQTLFTVLKQAQSISTQVMGPNRMTVISLDMGLYKPAKQLQMSRNDMDHIILRPGELHIVMAALRTIGGYIESSGVDLAWMEADIYGSATVKQILEGKHVKRAIEAHFITLQSLMTLYQEAFFTEYSDLKEIVTDAAYNLTQVIAAGGNTTIITEAHQRMVEVIKDTKITQKMSQFDEKHDSAPSTLVMKQYMMMIMEMMMFIHGEPETGICI